MKTRMQECAFQIIANAGMAKSSYVEAMNAANEYNFSLAEEKLKEGDEFYAKAHHEHFDIVQKEANGEDLPFSIIFMHAEDQLLNCETIKIMAQQIIVLNKKIEEKDVS